MAVKRLGDPDVKTEKKKLQWESPLERMREGKERPKSKTTPRITKDKQ